MRALVFVSFSVAALLSALGVVACGDSASTDEANGGGGNSGSDEGSGGTGSPTGGAPNGTGGNGTAGGGAGDDTSGGGQSSDWDRSGLDCSDWGAACGECEEGSTCAPSSPETCVPDPGGIVLVCDPQSCDGYCIAGFCLTRDEANCVCTGEAGAELEDCGGAGGECVPAFGQCEEGGAPCCGEGTCSGAGVCLMKV